MKLALIRRRYAATGGAELYLQRLLEALRGAGHETHLYTEKWEGQPNGIVLHPVRGGGGRATGPRRFAEAARREVARESFDCVFSLERTLRQDVYRAGDGVHKVWLQRRREFATGWRKWFIGRGAFHRQMLALEAAIFDPASTGRVIVNSEMVAREIVENFQFPKERIHLVRNGIQVERFQKGQRQVTRERYGFSGTDTVLLFVGSGWERKGLGYLLEAMRDPRLAAMKLLVVGKGKAPRQHPPNVVFAGAMARVEDAYAASDVFVFPPIYEPSANVCFEALAAGLPVVTTRQNGAAEVLQEGRNGTVLADPRDLEALVNAVTNWAGWRGARVGPSLDLSMERNIRETLVVLELAARERRAR